MQFHADGYWLFLFTVYMFSSLVMSTQKPKLHKFQCFFAQVLCMLKLNFVKNAISYFSK